MAKLASVPNHNSFPFSHQVNLDTLLHQVILCHACLIGLRVSGCYGNLAIYKLGLLEAAPGTDRRSKGIKVTCPNLSCPTILSLCNLGEVTGLGSPCFLKSPVG